MNAPVVVTDGMPGPGPAGEPIGDTEGVSGTSTPHQRARPRRRTPLRRRTPSVRLRILTVVLAVTALGMAVAGGTSYVIVREQTQSGLYASLRQETEEFRASAEVAADPSTGLPITTAEDVLSYAIKTTYPDQDEAVLGLVDGQVRKVPGADRPAHQRAVQSDQEFIAQAAAVEPGQSPGVYRAHTRANPDIAFVSVPLQIEGRDELSHYVTAIDMTTAYDAINRAYLVYTYAAVVTLLLVGAIGYGVAGRMLSPLRSLRRTAQRISDTDLSDRIEEDQLTSRDEVADLGRTMNAMLDRLSTSFDSQRQFLDDVGHELRTPITIIRGHHELMDASDPGDVTETRELTLDELDRMQRLVEDLLLLAKSRRPDFVRPAPTALDSLLTGVLEKVAPLGRREWTIEESTDRIAMLDAQRISQALLQLVSNALRFTRTDDVIALGAHVTDAQVRIWVRDEGSGIPSQQQEHIFARYTHSSADPAEHAHGIGLGLAIVTAIADAHHGHVDLTSTPGTGSRFTIIVPHRTEQLPRGDGTGGGGAPDTQEQEGRWPRS